MLRNAAALNAELFTVAMVSVVSDFTTVPAAIMAASAVHAINFRFTLC